jgi:hypothetical protein
MTERQREVLKQASDLHGFYPHTKGDRTVLENLWVKDLVIPACNGGQKWFATKLGRDLLQAEAST